MEDSDFDLKNFVDDFTKTMEAWLLDFRILVTDLIEQKSKNKQLIETTLEKLMIYHNLDIDRVEFIRLLEYYKTVDAKAAADFWRKFEKSNNTL